MLNIVDKAISMAGAALEIAIAINLLRQRLWRREFPLFFVYICYAILNVAILLISAELAGKYTYFAIFSVTQALYTVLGLLAINESFQKVFRVYYLRRTWFPFLVPSVVLAIALSALWNWAEHRPIQAGPLTIIYISLDLTANYMRAGLFGVFGMLVFFWRTKWQQRPFGVIVGFGTFSLIGMIADALRSDFGTQMNLVFSYASAVAYLIACLVWLRAFRRSKESSEKQPPSSNVDAKELLGLLEHYTSFLKEKERREDANKSFSTLDTNRSLGLHRSLFSCPPTIPFRR